MLDIGFYEFVEKDLWDKTFVKNEANLSPAQQRDIRREILANLSSGAIDNVIGRGKLDYGTDVGRATFLDDFATTAGRIVGWTNATTPPVLRNGAATAARQLATFATGLTIGGVAEQCAGLLSEKRMESLGRIAPAAENLTMAFPTVYSMPYKELLHNVTDRVWMYCYEEKHVPICKEQLVTWFRGNPDVAGVGVSAIPMRLPYSSGVLSLQQATQLKLDADVNGFLHPSCHCNRNVQIPTLDICRQMVEMALALGVFLR